MGADAADGHYGNPYRLADLFQGPEAYLHGVCLGICGKNCAYAQIVGSLFFGFEGLLYGLGRYPKEFVFSKNGPYMAGRIRFTAQASTPT